MRASGFFVLRTPLLPFDELLAWSESLTPARARDHDDSIIRDRQELCARLAAIVRRPEVREALFVASPTAYASLDAWLRDPESETGQKLEKTLVRYVSRMSSRATPFGLFAGCSVGLLGARTQLTLPALASYRRHTRLELDYACHLAESVTNDAVIARDLRYRPNSSLYQAAGRWRYAEARTSGRTRTYYLIAVETSEYLELVLARASATPSGATARELCAALIEHDPQIATDDAEAYVAELIVTQLLVPDVEPTITGPDATATIIAQLSAYRAASPITKTLVETRRVLSALDERGIGTHSAAYIDVERSLAQLPCDVEFPQRFQVDMLKPTNDLTLGANVVAELGNAVTKLRVIARLKKRPALDAFRAAFTARFERAEVPLTLALDDEAGVGFGKTGDAAPLLEDLPFDAAPTTSAKTFEPRHARLLDWYHDALVRGDREIVLGDDDLDSLREPLLPALPTSFSVLATLAAPTAAAADAGDFWLVFDGISPGASLLGRFCSVSPELKVLVERHHRDEEALAPDVVFAEIVHRPEGRVGHVIARPVLRDHEITFLGRSGACVERQITADDLLVSVDRGEIMLRSRRLGKRILPRLTNAHRYTARSIGLYRFLCELAREELPMLGWDWGPLASAPYLPRIRLGKLVLSLETWQLRKEELQALAQDDVAKRFRAVQQLRASRGLPRFVRFVESDALLVVDLDNVLSVDSFVQRVRSRDHATVNELAPTGDELCVTGPEGRFCHELVVPFVRVPDAAPRRSTRKRVAQAAPKEHASRMFAPGSEWLYAKLYTGDATADHVLRALREMLDEALTTRAADSWFFIRYADPDWHIRVRLHGHPQRLTREVLPAIHATVEPMLASGCVSRMQLDTYVREIERYGGLEGIKLAERWFDLDSSTVLKLLELEDAFGLEARWRLALREIDQLLSDFGLVIDARRTLIREVRDSFAAEHGASSAMTHALGRRYRIEKNDIAAVLDRENDVGPALAVINATSARVREITSELRNSPLTVSIEQFAASCVHMLVNRRIRSAARKHELVLYDFLDRWYATQLARRKTNDR
jgi:thiopeptide-type bacteriocin biosynthesis protein